MTTYIEAAGMTVDWTKPLELEDGTPMVLVSGWAQPDHDGAYCCGREDGRHLTPKQIGYVQVRAYWRPDGSRFGDGLGLRIRNRAGESDGIRVRKREGHEFEGVFLCEFSDTRGRIWWMVELDTPGARGLMFHFRKDQMEVIQ